MITEGLKTNEEINDLKYQDLVSYTSKVGAGFGFKYAFERKEVLVEKAIKFTEASRNGTGIASDEASVESKSEPAKAVKSEKVTATTSVTKVGKEKVGVIKKEKPVVPVQEQQEEEIDLASIGAKVSVADAIELWNLSKVGSSTPVKYIGEDTVTGLISISSSHGVVNGTKKEILDAIRSGELVEKVLTVPSDVRGAMASKPLKKGKEEKSEKPKTGKAVKASKEDKKSDKDADTTDIPLTDKHKTILDSKDYSKSDKIRKLYQNKMSVAHISKLLKIHYSFAYCVVDKFRKDHLTTNKK